MTRQEIWDRRWLGLADYVAQNWSKDPSTKVAALVVDGDRLVSSGYNGFPRGITDDESLLRQREDKYPRTAHAELNALLNASQRLDDCTLYCTLGPCTACALAIIQSGISSVVFYAGHPSRWDAALTLGLQMLQEAGLGIRTYERTSDEAAGSEGAAEPGCC